MDATKEFTLGNLEAVITLIGISYKGCVHPKDSVSNTGSGDPVAGVMYQPFVDDESGNGTTVSDACVIFTLSIYMQCKEWVSLVSRRFNDNLQVHSLSLLPRGRTVLLKWTSQSNC